MLRELAEKTLIVIGTHRSPAFVDLQMRMLERTNSTASLCPVLVYDDAPQDQDTDNVFTYRNFLADQRHTLKHGLGLGHSPGDRMVFAEGLRRASELGCTYMVKLSRRWIWTDPGWLDKALQRLEASGHHTLSHACSTTGFGFRTECCALRVEPWIENADLIEEEATYIPHVLVESYMHHMAADITTRKMTTRLMEHVRRNPKSRDFEHWPEMGHGRGWSHVGRIWHEADRPVVYANLAMAIGGCRYTSEFDYKVV